MSQAENVYGSALYSLCRDEGISDRVLQELTVLQRAFAENPDYLRLLNAPNVPVQERCGIVDSCFRDQVHIYVLNFLKILTERSMAKYFGDCVEVYRKQYNLDNDILPVTAVTAIPLSGEQSARLTEKLSQITGKKAQLHNRVDPECIGGVQLDYDGRRVDGSVATRLANVRELLKNTVL